MVKNFSFFLVTVLLSFFFLLMPLIHYAQESRIVVENANYSTSERPAVLLKWYSKELVYDEGVNLYRKQESSLNWEKMNANPIVRKLNVDPAVLKADPDLDVFVNLLKSASTKQLQEDIILFNLLLKSFQSNIFADIMGIYFEDTHVQSGERYEYKINRIKKGKEYLVGVSPLFEAGKYNPSPPIEDIKIVQKGKAVNLNWKHEEGRFYAVNVYRKSSTDSVMAKLNKKPLVLSQVTDSLGKSAYPKPMFLENLNLKEGQLYTYQLAGVGFFSNETQWSKPVEVFFKDVTSPPAPKDLEGKADSMKVHLRWKNILAEDLQGMNIYRSRKSEGPFEIITTSPLGIAIANYTDSLHLAGPYYYFIASIDKAKNEAHSNFVFVEVQDVIPPAQPEQVAIKMDTGRIRLSWKMNEEEDLAGYYLYRTVDKNQKKNYILLNAEPLRDNHYEQTLPKNVKNQFFYYVVAVDTSYNRSKPSQYVSGRMPDMLPPEKPFVKAVTYTADNIVLEWLANVDTDLAGYNIYRADTAKTFVRINVNILGRETFKYTDRDNEPNFDYFYYLEAVDSAGNISLHSKEVFARRVAKELQNESTLNLKIKYNKKRKQNLLSWEQSSSTPMLGFVVYRGELQNRLQPISGLIQLKNFVDKKDNKNKIDVREHYYQVRAYVGNRVIYSPILKQKL